MATFILLRHPVIILVTVFPKVGFTLGFLSAEKSLRVDCLKNLKKLFFLSGMV